MTRRLRSAFILAALAVAVPMAGCSITQDGNKTIFEPLTRFEGTSVTKDAGYGVGQLVSIESHNGSVDVRVGKQTGSVRVTFKPFTMAKDEDEQLAKDQINNDLHFGVDAVAGEGVTIRTSVDSGASGMLGADILVELPADFQGPVRIDQSNGGVTARLTGVQPTSTVVHSEVGSVDVSGAQGRLDITAGTGNIKVSVVGWSAEDGVVTQTGSGDLSFTVAGGLNGTIQATASDELTEAGIPSTWSSAGEGSSKTYTMGTGEGGNVVLSTSFGTIALTAN